jgi:ABC-type polar amino acid transport system ATPase subunit
MIYFSLFLSIFSFFCVLYAIARVRKATEQVKKVGFEDFADVQALKNQLKKTNNRLSGMDAPKHNAEQEAQELLQKMALNGNMQQSTKRLGG